MLGQYCNNAGPIFEVSIDKNASFLLFRVILKTNDTTVFKGLCQKDFDVLGQVFSNKTRPLLFLEFNRCEGSF